MSLEWQLTVGAARHRADILTWWLVNVRAQEPRHFPPHWWQGLGGKA